MGTIKQNDKSGRLTWTPDYKGEQTPTQAEMRQALGIRSTSRVNDLDGARC